MKTNNASLSKASSYKEISEFWSEHDLADFWDETKPVEFEVDIKSERRYYALDRDLSTKISKIAHQRGVSAETLVNMWLNEKLKEARC